MKISAIFFALLLALPFTVHAASTSQHAVTSCVTVNAVDYQDYIIFYTGTYHTFFANKITWEHPRSCSQNTGGTIVAIKASDWSKVKTSKAKPDFIHAPENSGLFVASPSSIVFNDVLPNENITATQNVTIHINSISDTGIDTSVTYASTEDANGQVLTQSGSKNPVVAIPPPVPSALSLWAEHYGVATAIVIVILAAFSLRFAYKLWNK